MCHLPEAGVLLDAMCASSNGGPFTDIHDLYLRSMVPMAWMRGGEDAREDPPASSSAAAAATAYNTSSEGEKQQVEKDDSSEEKKKKNFSKESQTGADFTEHLKHDMRTDADKSAARDAITSSPPNPRAPARADGHRTYRVPQSALHTGDSPPKYGYLRKFTLNRKVYSNYPFLTRISV